MYVLLGEMMIDRKEPLPIAVLFYMRTGKKIFHGRLLQRRMTEWPQII